MHSLFFFLTFTYFINSNICARCSFALYTKKLPFRYLLGSTIRMVSSFIGSNVSSASVFFCQHISIIVYLHSLFVFSHWHTLSTLTFAFFVHLQYTPKLPLRYLLGPTTRMVYSFNGTNVTSVSVFFCQQNPNHRSFALFVRILISTYFNNINICILC